MYLVLFFIVGMAMAFPVVARTAENASSYSFTMNRMKGDGSMNGTYHTFSKGDVCSPWRMYLFEY